MQCRACLKMDIRNRTTLDENYIKCFNLLTNLNIYLGDNMPQQLCKKCTRDLKFCVAFREKCINSNSKLIESLSIFENKLNLNHIKEEDIKNDHETELKEKIEIKIEGDAVKEESKSFDYFNEFDDNFEYEFIEDTELPLKTCENAVKPSPNLKRKKLENKKEMHSKSKKKLYGTCTYDCGLCTEKFDKEKLCDHVSSHRNSKYCNICSKHFTEWLPLVLHRVNHLPKKKLFCHICFTYFHLPTSLQFHYKIKHFTVDQKSILKCSDCYRSYKTVRHLQKHRRSCHTDNVYICNDCSKPYQNKSSLTYHIMTNHLIKKHFCDQCDYSSALSSNMKQHQIRKHTPGKVYCKVCYGVFENESKRDNHKCSGHKLAICPICGIVLDKKSKLSRHMATHSSERKYKCDKCPAAYKSKIALRTHINKHDGIRTKKCEYCPAAFYEQSVLIKHRRVHTGEKPYVCKICHKGFTGNNNLKVHMRVHGENLIKKKCNIEEESSIF